MQTTKDRFCYVHQRTPATLQCEQCARRICNACTRAQASRLVCPACVEEVKRRAGWKKVWVGVGVAAAIAGAGFAAWTQWPRDAPRPAQTIAEAQRAVLRDPDDPTLQFRLGELAWDAGLFEDAERAWKNAVRLHPAHIDAHRRLAVLYFEGDRRDDTRRHIERVLDHQPEDPESLLMLRQLDQATTDELSAEANRKRAFNREEKAAAAVRSAREEIERTRATARREADLRRLAEEETRRHAAALAAVEEVEEDTEAEEPDAPEAAEAEALEKEELERQLALAERDRLRAEAELAAIHEAPAPDGSCSVPLLPHAHGTSRVVAVVNRNDVNLLYDTGASLTTISREAAKRLQVRGSGEQLSMSTANGRAIMELGTVRTFALSLRTLRDLPVAICDSCAFGGLDGLLGTDVMGAMGLRVEAERGRVLISGCH